MNRILLIVFAVPAFVEAQSAVPAAGRSADRTADLALPAQSEREIHGRFGLGIPTAYFFRGIQRENQGLMVQPFLDLTTQLYQGDGSETLRNLELTFGQWDSLNTGPTGTAGGASLWFEHDFFAALDAKLDDDWRVGATYRIYYSPNAVFTTIQEVSFDVGYNDTKTFGEALPRGLQPSARIAFETGGQADTGLHPGVYAELAVAPEFELGKLGDSPVTLRLPATLGFSVYHYYELIGGSDSTFGFLDLGAELGMPMAFLPKRMGPWDGALNVHALFLGDSNRARNSGDRLEMIVSIGMSTTF